MTRLISFLLFLFLFVSAANAQNDITVKGTVLDVNTQLPLELATVYFTTVKDSTVIEYATTDKNGAFRMNIKKFDKPVFLKVNYMGYQTYYEEYKGLTESKDFGKIYLIENVNALNDVVIKTEAPPITIKKDSLEFNAASYKVRPDSNVETLLKQLPGFDVDNDGNITIDEKKNKGYFGKIMGGYGTDDRYEANVNLNYFNNKQKISLLASSNNINSTGFSMDDVFDNMGGGRNSSGRGGNTSSGGGGRGITQSNLVGVNYSYHSTEKLLAIVS